MAFSIARLPAFGLNFFVTCIPFAVSTTAHQWRIRHGNTSRIQSPKDPDIPRDQMASLFLSFWGLFLDILSQLKSAKGVSIRGSYRNALITYCKHPQIGEVGTANVSFCCYAMC